MSPRRHPEIVYTYSLFFSGRPKGSGSSVPFGRESFEITAGDDDKARAAVAQILKNWVFELDGLELRAPEFRRREWVPIVKTTPWGYGNE